MPVSYEVPALAQDIGPSEAVSCKLLAVSYRVSGVAFFSGKHYSAEHHGGIKLKLNDVLR